MDEFREALGCTTAIVDRLAPLKARYRGGASPGPAAASRGLFFSLPVAFDPAESIGPYLAITDRDSAGEPYRFLDMGALIATHAFGENDPHVVTAIVESLPFAVSRYAHSEY